MTASHWDRLPDKLKGLVYQFDSTAKAKFNEVVKELNDKFGKAMKKSRYEHPPHSINPSTGIAHTFYRLPIQVRRKSKVKNHYLKKKYTLTINCHDILPVGHNANAVKEQRKQHFRQHRWRVMVWDYLHRFWHIMQRMKCDPSMFIYKRLLN